MARPCRLRCGAVRPAAVHALAPQPPQPQLVYDIVVSEHLPCFDATIKVKQLLLRPAHVHVLDHVLRTIRPCLAPSYLLGAVVRIAIVFAPADVGALLTLLSLVLVGPTIITMSLTLRYEYIKLLAQTFEFGFLLVIGMMWIVSFAVYTHDLRGVIMPILWCDFVNLLLV
jgi:hypothetical protein